METFIVRVYRWRQPPGLVGTVEIVSAQKRISFRGEQELMAVLGSVRGDPNAERDRKVPDQTENDPG